MNLDSLTPEDTTVVLVDYAVGFANVLRSRDLGEHINNVVGLAKTAKLYGSGLVVTNGADSTSLGAWREGYEVTWWRTPLPRPAAGRTRWRSSAWSCPASCR